MRFYQGTTGFYCGVDLHARNMYLRIIDRDGTSARSGLTNGSNRKRDHIEHGPHFFLLHIGSFSCGMARVRQATLVAKSRPGLPLTH